MSTAATRIPLPQAVAEAERFRALFDGTYDRWEFAGSIRRKKPDIGDIEHVVIPRRDERESGDLYGSMELFNTLRARAEDLISTRRLALHNYSMVDDVERHRFGERYFGVDYGGRLHEVYMCEPDNWGMIMAIRTGSADFCQLLMRRLRANGYQSIGGRLFINGLIGQLELRAAPHEDTVLHAAGLKYEDWPPEKREVEP